MYDNTFYNFGRCASAKQNSIYPSEDRGELGAINTSLPQKDTLSTITQSRAGILQILEFCSVVVTSLHNHLTCSPQPSKALLLIEDDFGWSFFRFAWCLLHRDWSNIKRPASLEMWGDAGSAPLWATHTEFSWKRVQVQFFNDYWWHSIFRRVSLQRTSRWENFRKFESSFRSRTNFGNF